MIKSLLKLLVVSVFSIPAIDFSYGQNSKLLSFNTSIGVYQTKEYSYNTHNLNGSIIIAPGTTYRPKSKDYKNFFDQYGLSSKYGFSFEWKWKLLSVNLGLHYSKSYNNYAYEHRYTAENLYGKYKVKEKFTAFTFDPLVKIKLFKRSRFQFEGVVGVEMENLINYIQMERSMNIGTLENGKYIEKSNMTNKNRIVVNSYYLLLRPFAGVSASIDINERLIFEIRPIITLPDVFAENSEYTLVFDPYSGGEYRSSITLSTVVSVGYKL